MSNLEAAFDYYLAVLAPELPPPVAEYRFAAPRRWRFDRAWPCPQGGGLAVELDGGQWAPQGGRHARDTDREKLNAAAAAGWRVLRFSGELLDHDPAGCLLVLRRALDWQRDKTTTVNPVHTQELRT
jgi:hypothetical protein